MYSRNINPVVLKSTIVHFYCVGDKVHYGALFNSLQIIMVKMT